MGYDKETILSPKIFAMYMNGVTDELSNSYAGCYINDKCIKNIMYADYICLMAPTGMAMQNLPDVCHNYGVIALPCTVTMCGQNTRKRLLVKFK